MLKGSIAIVTGASRGVGRGIALQLGEAGCTVYLTGRVPKESLAGNMGLPSLEKTAEEVTARGGRGIARYVDHGDMKSVQKFFNEFKSETQGQLDILVNNAYSGVPYIADNLNKKFHESDPDLWDHFNNVGLRNHYFCSVYGARLMVPRNRGVIVNLSSVGGLYTVFNVPYGVGKAALDRMTKDMGVDLKNTNVSCLSLWPGAVKTELIMGVVEGSKGGIGQDNINDLFTNGESTEFVGKAVVALTASNIAKEYNGRVVYTQDMALRFGFKDVDGRDPPHMRSVRNLLVLGGRTELAKYVPAWIKLPGWMLMVSESNM